MKILRRISVIVMLLVITLAAYYFYPSSKLPSDVKIDKLVVLKNRRTMEAYHDGKLLKTYTIALGKNPAGHKQFEGDGKTPEGIYYINDRNPNSSYHKNLGISYPNTADKAFAAKMGKSAGGQVKIHGLPNGRGYIHKFHRWQDWTLGCIAITNDEVDELYAAVVKNAVIEIKP